VASRAVEYETPALTGAHIALILKTCPFSHPKEQKPMFWPDIDLRRRHSAASETWHPTRGVRNLLARHIDFIRSQHFRLTPVPPPRLNAK